MKQITFFFILLFTFSIAAPSVAMVFVDDANSALFITITEEEANDMHKVDVKNISEKYTNPFLFSYFDVTQNSTLVFNDSLWKIIHPEITLPPPEIV